MVLAEDEDFRFLYIPLVFPLLRVWRIVMDLLQISNHNVPFTIKVLAVSNENTVQWKHWGEFSYLDFLEQKSLLNGLIMANGY